jgi:hypothetical protein
MNHLARVRETKSVTRAICHDDGARRLIRFVARPVTLKLQEHLYPTCEACACLLQSSQSEFVALRGQAAAGVANNEDLKAILQRREHRKGHAGFREESCNDQSPPIGREDCIFGCLILPIWTVIVAAERVRSRKNMEEALWLC